ncbi:MAG TPA: class I SAM-dependent methyltransferase [Candidatus Dormibacteraeota bacterium]|nr:class I SAM-dependent methyltransferase [Candidatus Dormibacteraeota bacterium]
MIFALVLEDETMLTMHHHDVDRFGEWAPTYEQHWMQRRIMGPVQETVLELASAQVPQPASILDIGCGTGRLLRAAAARFPGARLDGVDAAEGMVKQAEASLPPGLQIRFQQATAESLPFSDAAFDLVFSTMTFHHWSDQQKAVGEVKRVLAPGGRWLLADMVADGPMVLVVKLLRIGRVVSPSGLDRMLRPEGLGVTARKKVPGTGGYIPVLAIGAL